EHFHQNPPQVQNPQLGPAILHHRQARLGFRGVPWGSVGFRARRHTTCLYRLPGTFFNNPQFRLRVGGSSDQEAGHNNEQDEHWRVLLELMQTDGGAQKLHIACHLYQVPQDLVSRPRLDRGFFTRNRPVCDTGEPQNSRGGVTMRVHLPAGEYVIVPSTYDANQEGNFYIRVCCERDAGSSAPCWRQLEQQATEMIHQQTSAEKMTKALYVPQNPR
ncbi:unnamed protein product, partial [Staurois parvus]